MCNGRVGKLQLGEEVHHADGVLGRNGPGVAEDCICWRGLPRVGVDVAPIDNVIPAARPVGGTKAPSTRRCGVRPSAAGSALIPCDPEAAAAGSLSRSPSPIPLLATLTMKRD